MNREAKFFLDPAQLHEAVDEYVRKNQGEPAASAQGTPMTAAAASWLEVLPAIPLTGYVGPVIAPETGMHGVCLSAGGDGLALVFWFLAQSIDEDAESGLRPDLADPQGLHHALDYIGRLIDGGPHYCLVKGLALSLLFGHHIPDGKLVELARAIAEVQS